MFANLTGSHSGGRDSSRKQLSARFKSKRAKVEPQEESGASR